jgi:hypothetical protein
MKGSGFDEVVDGFGLGEVKAAGEEGALCEFAGFGESGAGGNALAEEVVEEDRGAMGGDLYDVFGGVGVGCGEVGDDGFVEGFSCSVKDFGEAGLGGSEGMAELEEGFCDGSGRGAGETDDADAAAAGWSGDGDDGFFRVVWGVVFGVGHVDFFMLAAKKFGTVSLWCFVGVFAKSRVQNVVF